MNRTVRRCPKWSWLRQKELNKFLSPIEQPQLTGITRHSDAINAFITGVNAVAHLGIDQENAPLDNLIKGILLTVDSMDDYFVDLFKQGYI